MEQFIITKTDVNFRTGPGTSYLSIKVLPINTVVEILDTVDNTTWYKAKLENGTIGYITSLLKYVGSFEPEWLTKAKTAIAWGESKLGVAYEFGSSRSNDSTFDCSDFTRRCMAQVGLDLGWTSRAQSIQGTFVPKNELRTGDLVFYSKDTDSNGIDDYVYHVGIYIHPNKTLHTYRVGIGVTYSDFTPSSYWYNACDFGRRVL